MTTDNTLNTENYTYEPFSHNGFSGSLYLATAKDGSLQSFCAFIHRRSICLR